MSLCDKYQQFLANPTAAALADKSSSINYVPTLTTINQPAAIIKHLQTQAKIVKKKSEKVLGAIESSDALSADVEMTKNTENGHAPKAGFGKHYARNRLFDENEPGNKMKSPDGIKTNPNKYNHFNFGDGEDVATKASINDGRPTSSKSNKAVASWNFEDFVTPEKVRPKEYPGTTQHIDLFENEDVTSPVKRPVVHQARPDAIPHFEFNDNGTPQGDRKQPIARGRMHSKGMGMYEENIIGDEETDIALNGRKGPLSNVTNVNHGRRNNESHFEMADQSPKPTRKQVAPTDENDEFQHFASVPPGDAAAKKPQRHMDSHWDLYDTSPAAAKKEKRGEIADKGIYKTAGDGMGGRKNASRTWGFGDESDDEANVQAFRAEKRQQAPAEKSFWDFDGQ
ncbi:hypothetical protein LTR16_003728 [Cryomyces antarcticus]|uniref:Uncharacterized protein n=1 Tax=Cryomyces antarcticus TaxID=329879 RepID=A0ABR0LNR4_9PEZI|nr:hypothetical protein LTR16_003728 [Cryomyces antarcticus]